MLFFLAAGLIGISYIFRKSNIVFYMWALFFILLFGFNTYNPDYLSYSNIYRLFSLGTYDGKLGDIGYISLMNLGISNRLYFQQFLQVISVITIIPLFYSINKLSVYKNLVCAFILLYPLSISIVQFRFFIAYTLVLLGLYFLEKFTIGKYIFIALVILATTIHFSAIIFLILLFALEKNFQKIYLILSGVLLALFSINYIGNFIQIPLISQALQKYFISSLEFKGIVFVSRVIFFRLGPVLILHWLYSYFKHCFEERDFFLMRATNIILIVSMFFEFINSEFERFSRLGYILFYIIVLNVCSKMKLKSNRELILVSLIIFSLSNFWFQNFYRSSGDIRFFDSVFRAIFENNLVLY
ncbi:TPA: EpsG family protein [Streptococcus suis]